MLRVKEDLTIFLQEYGTLKLALFVDMSNPNEVRIFG